MPFRIILLTLFFFMTQGHLPPFEEAVSFSQEGVLDSNVYIAEGYGFIIENDIAGAKNKAINSAFKNLLKEGLIEVIGFRRYLKLEPLLIETILSAPQPFIESYRVLTERQEGIIYTISIEGRVYEDILEKRLSSIGLYLKGSEPKILLMIVEKGMGGPPAYWWSGVESGMGRMDRIAGDIFMDAGFSVINPFAPPIVDMPLDLRTPFLGRDETKRFGDIFRADLILYGEVGKGGGDIPFIFTEKKDTVWFKFKVFSIPTGEVVISDYYEVYSLDSETPDNRLLYERLSMDLPKRVVSPLVKILGEEGEEKGVIEVVFTGTFNYNIYTTIKKAFEEADKMVERAEVKSLSRGKFTMKLETRVKTSVVLKYLQEKEWIDFMLKLSYLDRGRLIFEILPKKGGI